MPIYFILDDDGEFSGGVRVGWDTDERDVTFGVFISAAFDFLSL